MKRLTAPVRRILLLVLLPFLLAGCDQALVMNVLAPPQDKSVAEYYIGLFLAGNFGIIERDLDPSMDSGAVNAKLTQAFNLLPHQQPLSVKLVGMHVLTLNGVYTTSFSYEYQYPGAWFLISISTRGKGSDFRVTGLAVQPMGDALENINHFSLAGKSLLEYCTAAAIPVVFLISLYAFILCIQDRGLKRRWAWIIFVALGVGSFAVNWTTGEYGVNPISVQLFSFSAFATPYGPWIIRISFPLGALLYLVRRRMRAAVQH